ncbi:MAG: PTS sugar transporter subunit IIA [Chitinispirillaceae bacterium]|nr:PTS sugar transporter subunit IIA [Chitinispirillaceae bacterium]
MAIIDLISPEVIRVGLAAKDKPSVLRELLQVLIDAGKVIERDEILEALLKREMLQSTGLESGIAVPHAKTTAVASLTLAIGTSPEGIDFDAIDHQPSKLFFLMLAPPDKSGPHIEALAEIARMSRSHNFISALISAKTVGEVMELFRE